ncbi:MAG TPA: extracellular solute-binding protein [Actinopolymorphaceae bacterium]
MKERKLGRRGFLAGAASVLSLAGASATSGCAVRTGSRDAARGSGGGRKGVTTLTVMMPPSEVTPEVIKGFETANPDITINLIKDDQTRLTAMLAAGEPPDVARESATGFAFYPARGLAENLDPYVKDSSLIKESDLAPINDLWRYDGQMQGRGPRYGLTKDYSQDATLWANRTLFEQAGVDLPPDTEPLAFEGIPELAARLTRNTKDDKTAVFGYGGTVDLTMAQLAHMVAAQGGSLFNDDLSAVDFSSPEAVKAIQYWLDLARANVSYGPTRPNPAGWDGNAYIAGRIALLSMGYWFQGQLAGTPEVAKVSVFLPAPTFAGKRLSPTYYGTGVWIPSKAKNKDAAWRFVEYFIAGEPAKQRAASGWGIPSLKSLEPLMPHKTPEERQVYEVQRRELPYFDIVVVATPYVRPQALAKILSAEFKAAVPSGTSAGKVADSLNRQINDLIAQEKGKVG